MLLMPGRFSPFLAMVRSAAVPLPLTFPFIPPTVSFVPLILHTPLLQVLGNPYLSVVTVYHIFAFLLRRNRSTTAARHVAAYLP